MAVLCLPPRNLGLALIAFLASNLSSSNAFSSLSCTGKVPACGSRATFRESSFSRVIVRSTPSTTLGSDEIPLILPDVEPSLQQNVNGSVASTDQVKPSSWKRLREALPGSQSDSTFKEGLDKLILSTSIPSMINLAVVPIVNSVDTFWVGRMGNALALAGQTAANQAFFTIFFLVTYLPTITAPLVAAAVGSGNQEEAKKRVCESIFLSNLLGGIGTILLVGFPATVLSMILPNGAPALEYATPYLSLRALSMIPALFSATGFATFRGMLDTVTPLKVSLATNLLNLVLDPLLIFASPLGFVGAALATAFSEAASGLIYLRLLLKRKLVTPSLLLRPPSLKSLMPLLQGGASMLGRQLAINIGLISAARRAQSMDPTGESG
jgi:Na+-driven multidrug efflux pump